MLFNAPEFLFGFLPIVLLCFFGLQAIKQEQWQSLLLLAASLFFYGWWSLSIVPLLIASVVINYLFGSLLLKYPRRLLLAAALTVDFGILAYFKYADFGISSVNALFGSSHPLTHIVLPLGISFFTFTQAAFLIDAYRGNVTDRNPIRYALFVTFFPHLIAGPILHHREMTDQFRAFEKRRVGMIDLSVGITIFVIGLFKKVVLADSYAPFVDRVFDVTAHDGSLTTTAAWFALLSYTFQLYFDFSGYTDMAIGLARMVGVRMPQNFNSPYKSASIAEFWTRWHMTLSRFLRDYLYIPLGGNRRGALRSHINVFITMLLGGLWHGAGWTLVIWGGLHGMYIIVNRLWSGLSRNRNIALPHIIGVVITFGAVMLAWVPFRSSDFGAAVAMFRALFGQTDFGALPDPSTALLVALGLLVVWALPNTTQLLARYRPVLAERGEPASPPTPIAWRLSPRFAVALGALTAATILCANHVSQFLYFQF